MWWYLYKRNQRRCHLPYKLRRRGVRLCYWHRHTSHIEDSVRQTILEIVQRANSRLHPASWGSNRAVYEAIHEKIERALICQSSSEMPCGIINSLSFWCHGSTSQHPCSNHSLWALKAFQVYKGCLKRSVSRCRGFHNPEDSAIYEEEDDNHCHHTSMQFTCITFTSEDKQVKEKHDRLLHYTGYIRSSEVSRIQVDLGSTLSIMPRRVIQHLEIPTYWLIATQTTILVSMPMVWARWEKLSSDAKLGIWDPRWHVTLLTLTPRTTCC